MNETASYDAVIKALRMLKKIRRLEGTVLIHEGVLLNADTLLHDSQNEAFVREVNALVALYRNGDNALSRALIGFDGGNVILFHAAPFTLALLFGDLEQAEVVEKAGEDFLHQWADSLKIQSEDVGRLPELSSDDLEYTPAEEENLPSEEDTLPIAPLTGATSPPPEADQDLFGSDSGFSMKEEALAEPNTAQDTPPETSTTVESSMDTAPEKLWNAYREKVEILFSKVLGRAQATRILERELTAMGVQDGGYLAPTQFRPFGQKLIKKVKDRTLRKQLELELVSIVESFID